MEDDQKHQDYLVKKSIVYLIYDLIIFLALIRGALWVFGYTGE